jgi:hypothetical protein
VIMMSAQHQRNTIQATSHTKCEGIHCSLVVVPLISQRRLEQNVGRLEVDARDGYFAIFIEYGRGRDWRLSCEGGRNSNGEVGRVHVGRAELPAQLSFMWSEVSSVAARGRGSA